MATKDVNAVFDGMQTAEPSFDDDDPAEWVESEEMKTEGWTVSGRLLEKKENCGENNSRVYKVVTDSDEKLLFWGKVSIDRQIDEVDARPGDYIAIACVGSYEGKNGTGFEYKVGVRR